MNKIKYFLVVAFLCLKLGVFGNNSPDTASINALFENVRKLERINMDSARQLNNLGLLYSQQINYQDGIAAGYMRLGSILPFQEKNDSALYYLRMALAIRKNLNKKEVEANTALQLSFVFHKKGNKDSTFYYIYYALKLYTQLHDSAGMGDSYNRLAESFLNYGNYSQALLELKKAEIIFTNLGDSFFLSRTYKLYGMANYYRSEPKEALVYFDKAHQLDKKLNNAFELASDYNYLGLCYVEIEKFDIAKNFFNKALAFYSSKKMVDNIAEIYYNLGIFFYKQDLSDSAIFYFEKADETIRVNGLQSLNLDIFFALSELYAQTGNFSKAYDYHVSYANLKDSLLNNEKVKQIAEMQTQYETQLKTNEIAILQNKNEVANLKAARRLGITVGLGLAFLGILAVAISIYRQSKKKQKFHEALAIEKQKSDTLLLNILPEEVATELKEKGHTTAKQFNHVTVMFTDFINFTGLSEQMTPTELVSEIHAHFTAFDAIIEKHGLEKIKTIGDAYLAVCGLPIETENHAQKVVLAALDICSYMDQNAGKFKIRLGIHSGPVVAGIVGVKKYAYDIWGDTVNTASRMESTSEVGKVNISGATYQLVKEQFEVTYRGKIPVKGKGDFDMYFVNRSQSEG